VDLINNPFPFKWISLDKVLKYLGFRLKRKSYVNKGWDWLMEKCEREMSNLISRWLSKGGGLVLIKLVS
jgi:hypothetical protein